MTIEEIDIGQLVRYCPTIGGQDDGKTYEVKHVGYIAQRYVAWLKGKSGCVALEALRPVPPQPQNVSHSVAAKETLRARNKRIAEMWRGP